MLLAQVGPLQALDRLVHDVVVFLDGKLVVSTGLKAGMQPTLHHYGLQMDGNVLRLVLLGDVEEVMLVVSQNITIELRVTSYQHREEGYDVLLRGVALGEVGEGVSHSSVAGFWIADFRQSW